MEKNLISQFPAFHIEEFKQNTVKSLKSVKLNTPLDIKMWFILKSMFHFYKWKLVDLYYFSDLTVFQINIIFLNECLLNISLH